VDLQELEAWFQDRPKWLQDAARRLVQNGALTEQDFSDLLAICTTEVTGQTVTYASLPTGALGVQDTTMPLRLDSIGDIQGINALSPSKPLELGKTPLCIVYGRNGAGKSGYVRLLKHACGARRPGDLLGNIFVTGPQPQAAKLTFTEDAQTKAPQWTGKPIPELQGVEIYDTACGLVYVNDENEVAFEPWLLRLFTQLTDACTTLSQRIQAQIARQASKKPVFPAEYTTTSAATWYANITGTTTAQEVDNNTAWTPEHEACLPETNRRLAETNPTAKAAALRRQKALLLELVADLQNHFQGLALERCSAYLQAKADATTKRKAADEDAKKAFGKAPLAGIGSESWRLLWKAARKYSEEHAYKAVAFPNLAEDARCVLCQRELDEDSRDRFVSFEKFVKSELQRLASEAEQNLQETAASFPEVPTTDTLAVKVEAAGIAEGTVKAMVTDFASGLAMRRQTCLAAEKVAEISAPPSSDVLPRLETIAADIERQAVACDEDAKGQNRPELERRAKELSARKWLLQQRKAIDDEITRLKTVNLLGETERLTNTQALSKRKSILADELITNAYVQRFKDELIRLKASPLAVELKKTRAEVGRVYHRITLRNVTREVKTLDILSEGEFRIVSLAAFLADTEGRGARTPFIFDDPISSLDHVFEEATALRLVELSQTRQVIVFTHRLSLVGFLEKYANKRKIKTSLVCLSRYVTGDVTELPIDLKRTDKAAHSLANERLAAAKKAFAEGDVAYEKEAKGICRDIRILLERIIEMDLTNGVVRRFSPEVNTKGKIYALSKITEAECKFVDDYMTKYSLYEHSQPEEAPSELPKPEEIEFDLNAISSFIAKVRQRNAIQE
jgi:energy-coupling factor transporter ATP-binding protein EcfA2